MGWKLPAALIVPTAWLFAVCVLTASDPGSQIAPDAVLSNDGHADERRCAECHEQAEHFWDTGHANSLLRTSDRRSLDSLDRLKETLAALNEGMTIEKSESEVLAMHRKQDSIRSARLDWCVGSGNHARTWISTFPDITGSTGLLEFRWTWYEKQQCFAQTPGHSAEVPEGFFGGLGVLFDDTRALRCFSCHSSFIPTRDDVIDEAGIVGGVSCQRCHGPRENHVASEGTEDVGLWKPASRTDAVNRCAQCHRSAEEQSADEIRTDNTSLVRFQPVGMVQSRCFQESAMTCTTCHDPHRPLQSQNSRGIWQCVQCHSPENPDDVLCGNGQSDNCLDCHMPSVKLDSPLELTDHWIRVR